MATLSLTMQAAIFHLSQLKTELERAKNTIEQFTNFPLSVNNGPPADIRQQVEAVKATLDRMADIESDYLTLQNAIDAKNRETGTGLLLNEVSAKRRRLKLLEPLAAVFNAPKANFQAESGVGLVEYGLPGYDDVLKTVTALRAEVNRLSLAIDKSNATTEVTVDLKTVTPLS